MSSKKNVSPRGKVTLPSKKPQGPLVVIKASDKDTRLAADALQEQPAQSAMGPDATLDKQESVGHGLEQDLPGAVALENHRGAFERATFFLAEARTVVGATAPLPHDAARSLASSVPDAADGSGFLTGLTPVLYAAAGLGIAAVAAGGGSSSAPPAPAPTGTVSGTVTLGPVISGHQLTVQLYQADGTTALGSPVAVGADGRFTATVTGYTGVIKAKLIDGGTGADFKDEATGADKDISGEFWAVGNVTANGALTLNINPLTTLAYKKLGANPTAAQVDAALAAVETAFGLNAGSLKSTTPIATNSDAWAGADKTSAAAKLGMVLATLSGLDALNNGDMATTITDLAAGLDLAGTLSDTAKNLLLAGAAQADATVTGTGGLSAAIARAVDSGAQAAATGFTASTDVTSLSTAAVALLTNDQLGVMTEAQIGALSAPQLAVLTGPQIAALGTDIIGLDAAEVAALSNIQLQALTPAQKNALQAAGDFSALSVAQQQLLGININVAPVVANAIADQTATEDTVFNYTIAANAFSDVDGDSLSYSVSTLPAGLSFNASTRVISGTPTMPGTTEVTVTVSDGNGGSTTDTFNITTVASNTDTTPPSAPTLALASDSGSSNSDGVTNVNTVNVGGLEAGGQWRYSLDGGTNWSAWANNPDTGSASFDLTDNDSYAIGAVTVQQRDGALNVSDAGQNAAAWEVLTSIADFGFERTNGSTISYKEATSLTGIGQVLGQQVAQWEIIIADGNGNSIQINKNSVENPVISLSDEQYAQL